MHRDDSAAGELTAAGFTAAPCRSSLLRVARHLASPAECELIRGELDRLRPLLEGAKPEERLRLTEKMGRLSQALMACSAPPSLLGRTVVTASPDGPIIQRFEGPGRLVPTGEPLASETQEGARALALLAHEAATAGMRPRRRREAARRRPRRARPGALRSRRTARPRGRRGRRARRAAARGSCRAGPGGEPGESEPPGDLAHGRRCVGGLRR